MFLVSSENVDFSGSGQIEQLIGVEGDNDGGGSGAPGPYLQIDLDRLLGSNASTNKRGTR